MTTVRKTPGVIAPDRVQDIESRRVLQSIMSRVQWIIDNWPATAKPLAFEFSVANYNGRVQLVGDEVPQKVRRFYGHDAAGQLGFFTLPDDPSFQMSIVNTSGVVTLVNDLQDVDYGQRYGVDVAGARGWVYPVEHPFRFQQVDDNGGDITAGLVRLNGVNLTVTVLPITALKVSTRYWIALDTVNATAEWLSGTVEAYPTFPVGSDSIMIFPILTITCAGAVGSEVITAIRQERWVDIVVQAATADTEPDPEDPSTYVDIMSRDGNDPPVGPGDSTALVNTWAAGGVNGLHKWWNAGTVWDGYAATPVLYYMSRRETITTKGKIFGDGAEARIIIDTPVNHADL